MDPILVVLLWIGGVAAVGSAVGVVIALVGWWLIRRMAERERK
jgi:protein-S-isoprenylcysteine O-methyltransferase Ste14